MLKLLIFTLFLVLLTVIPSTLGSTKCYRCSVSHPSSPKNTTKQLCSTFEETNQYVIDCPFSTMCMKRIFSLKLLDGTEVKTITRDCAYQKKVNQAFKNGQWIKETAVEEIYDEGCENTDQNSVICHCRGSYCNSSPASTKDSSSFSTDAMTVLFLFNALKFLKHVEY